MPDPFGIEEGVESIRGALKAGKSIEDMMGEVATFVTKDADLRYKAAIKAKRYGSDEHQAVAEFVAKKKWEAAVDKLRADVCREYGPQAWTEIQRLMADIKDRKAKAEKERENQKARLWFLFSLCLMSALFFGFKAGWNL